MTFADFARKARTTVVVAVAAASLAAATVPSASAAENRIKVGVLTCAAGPSIGLIIAASEKVNCSFQPHVNETEHYSGHIRKVGLELGITAASVIIWAVFAAQSGYQPGSLAGTYLGVSASESVVVGLGANILVGGSNKSIILQPLSVQAQAGLNLAVGISELELSAR